MQLTVHNIQSELKIQDEQILSRKHPFSFIDQQMTQQKEKTVRKITISRLMLHCFLEICLHVTITKKRKKSLGFRDLFLQIQKYNIQQTSDTVTVYRSLLSAVN